MRYLIFFLSIFLIACEPARNDRASDDPPTRVYRPQVERQEEAPPVDITTKHPRLIALDEDVVRTNKLIQEDPTAKQWFAMNRERCEVFIRAGPLEQPRGEMLHTSREAMIRITNLAGAYRLTKDLRYAQLAVREMLAVSRFIDWQPNDFLSTAEMTFAVSIG